MKAAWQREKEAISQTREIKERLEQAHREAERAEREADLKRAAELRYGEIPELEKRLAEPSRTHERETTLSSRRRSTRRTSPRSSRSGPAFRSPA